MRRCSVAVVVMLATLFCSAAYAATAPVLCVKRNGRLMLRDACRKHERVVDPATLDLLRQSSSASGELSTFGSPDGAFPLRVVDANGVEVGDVIRYHPAGLFARERDGAEFDSVEIEIRHASLPVRVRLDFVADGNGYGDVGYELPNCAGVPYMKSPRYRRLDAAVEGVVSRGVAVGHWLYYRIGPPVRTRLVSIEQPGGGHCFSDGSTDRGNCCMEISQASEQDYIPVAAWDLDILGLVPPFRAIAR